MNPKRYVVFSKKVISLFTVSSFLDIENDKINNTSDYVPEDEQNILDNELLQNKESSESEYIPSEGEQNTLNDELPQKRISINTTKR